jgi:PAS domain S-box-containing protein
MDKESPGYFRVDEDGVIRAWDDRMTALTGHESDEVLGRSMEILIPESYVERHWHGFRMAMSRGATKHDQPALNVPLRHKDGSFALHPAREIFLRDGFGSSAGVLAIIHPECKAGLDNGLPSPYEDALTDMPD